MALQARVLEVIIFDRALSRSEGWYERAPSTRELSVRQVRSGPTFIKHRFPFPGALSEHQVMYAYVASKCGM